MRSVIHSVNRQTSHIVIESGSQRVELDSTVVRDKNNEVIPDANFHLIHWDPQPDINPHKIVYFSMGLAIAEVVIIGIVVMLFYLIDNWGFWITSWNTWIIIVLGFPGFGVTLAFFGLQMLDTRIFLINYVLKGTSPFFSKNRRTILVVLNLVF